MALYALLRWLWYRPLRRAGDVERHHYGDGQADDEAQHDTKKCSSGLLRLLRRAAGFCHCLSHLRKFS
ncbi:hypothetical protein AQ752_24295 [Burkholderia pseudomallei]|nr:hypothetical protein AQ752_24295 [Burkholderia pseudomallei]